MALSKTAWTIIIIICSLIGFYLLFHLILLYFANKACNFITGECEKLGIW